MKILKGEEYPDASVDFHAGFEAGVRAVLAIRCMAHREAPILNRNVCDEAECPICETASLREEINELLRGEK